MAILEWKLQAYVSTQLKRRNILHHGDQNAGKRGPKAASMAKATGMCSGWPDLQVILPNEVVFIEYKTLKGKVSANQADVHTRLNDLGFKVYVIAAGTEIDAWDKTREVLCLK